MNHLKIFEFFDPDSQIMEDLCDYLQELFDKFSIKKHPQNECRIEEIYWYHYRGSIFIENIPAESSESVNVNKILNELNKIRHAIEKRIHRELFFGVGQNGYVSGICWIRITLTSEFK